MRSGWLMVTYGEELVDGWVGNGSQWLMVGAWWMGRKWLMVGEWLGSGWIMAKKQ